MPGPRLGRNSSKRAASDEQVTPNRGLRRRRFAIDVHLHLRELIVQGHLAPHTVLSQAAIARELGVSRGPVREAFRRLQEESLITAEPDHRPRVAGFDPVSLDSLYGARIVLETLGAGMTAAVRTPDLLEEMQTLLLRMDEGLEAGDLRWRQLHRRFHATVVSGAGPVMVELTVSLAERSEPYYRLYGPHHVAAHADHRLIYDAIAAGDANAAIQLHARHVSRTALTVLANVAPEYEPLAIRSALRMCDRRTKAA